MKSHLDDAESRAEMPVISEIASSICASSDWVSERRNGVRAIDAPAEAWKPCPPSR